MSYGDDVVELFCSDDTRIVEVRHHGPGESEPNGLCFVDIVDAGSADKARQFLRQLGDRGRAYDWELNLPVAAQPVCFHFAGRRVRDRLWIVAARSRRRLLSLLERGSGAARSAAAEADAVRGQVDTVAEGFAYDELTRVNNEMATLHRDVAKQASELAKLDRRKNELLGMAAHDLRNPVAAIHAYSELLEADLSSSLDAERLEFLTTIKTTSKFLLELVNDLLDLATIEAGELRLRRERADLVSLVDDTVRLNRILARKKQVEIQFVTDIERVDVHVDVRKLRQVVDNLLANAIKFSPAGGVIDVHVGRERGRIIVAVADRGRGVDAEEKEKLFLPFHRGSSERSSAEGAGLGLAICRRIVEGHGGGIGVESESGRGAVFSFSIPENSPS